MIMSERNLISSVLATSVFSTELLEEAKERFAQLQGDSIIRTGCSFDDTVWATTDEYSNIGLHFKFNLFSYTSNYYPLLNIQMHQFVDALKTFILSLIGRYALATIQSFLLDMRHITLVPPDQIYAATDEIHLSCPLLCADFFTSIYSKNEDEPPDDLDHLIYAMDTIGEISAFNSKRRQRTLADFDTYFLFNDILNDFWASELSNRVRLFYYPLYLWWQITAVIPLRPREFLVTQRDCLSIKDGEYYLSLRRNKLKGNKKMISYKLADDYVINSYKIPQRLGDQIQEYKNLTDGYDSTDIDTLFVTDTHYSQWRQKKHSDSRYLTYTNLRTILRYFYMEIIQKKYKLRIVEKPENDRHLLDDEIAQIHLGDTRHLALINLMQSGGTPVAAMLLAGHDSPDMASHYYSNLEHLIECRTYRLQRKVLGGKGEFQLAGSTIVPKETVPFPLGNGGMCFSSTFQNDDYSDCLETVGPNGEIGYCPSCPHYRNSGATYYDEEEIYKRNMKDDCIALTNAIEAVRKQHGAGVETLGSELLKLRASATTYELFLKEKTLTKNGGD